VPNKQSVEKNNHLLSRSGVPLQRLAVDYLVN